MNNFEYAQPQNLSELLDLLRSQSEKTELLGGGTDLVGLMKIMIVTPDRVVNLCDVAEWCQYVVGMGVKERLEALLEHDDPMLVRYAVSRATALPPAAALRGRV